MTDNTQTQTIDYSEMEAVDIADLFPEMGFNHGAKLINRRKYRHPDCKPSNKSYVPEKELLERFICWWTFPVRLKPFGLHGETGTGKTEMLFYVADRLNEPVYLEKVTSGMTSEGFEGNFELVVDENGNQQTVRNYSNAAKGYKHGGLVILDEVDKANEDLQTALHLFLEGKPWTISVFKETIQHHSNCRIVATANTLGEGGHERYLTSNRMDMALRSRFGWEMANFPSDVHEMDILNKHFPRAFPNILKLRMVKTANALRDAVLGPARDGDIDNPLGCVFSTRTLVQWGEMTLAYGKKRTLMDSLKFAFWGSVDPDDRADVEAIIQRIWADDINTPVGDLLATMAGNASKKQ